MSRSINLMLCFCFSIVCSFVGYLGYFEWQKASRPKSYAATPCADVLNATSTLADTPCIELTDFQHGKSFVPIDHNLDGSWEEVYVPLFPASTRRLDHNYGAVVVRLGNVANKEQLNKTIASNRLEAEFWPSYSELNEVTYSKLAKRYPSMDFNRCVLVHSGYSTKPTLGLVIILLASTGVAISLIVAGVLSFTLLRQKSNKTNLGIEHETPGNKFGLPIDSSLDPVAVKIP